MPAPNPSRRAFLTGALAAGAAGLLGACSRSDPTATAGSGGSDAPTTPGAASGSTAAGPGSAPAAGAGSTASPGAPSSTKAPAGSSTSSAPAGPVTARFVDHADGAGTNLALTFHTNGDLRLAQQLFDVLGSHHTVATCFIIGNWLEANPTWAAKLTGAGHELANHTFTHPDFTKLSASAMATEITKCRDVLRKLNGGNGGRFFRPSGTDDGTADPGPTIMDQAGKAGYPYVAGFDVDPLDYQDPGADAVRDRTLAKVHPGAIVSLHFGHPGTIAALPAILDGITAKGLTPVTLSTLFP